MKKRGMKKFMTQGQNDPFFMHVQGWEVAICENLAGMPNPGFRNL